MKERMLFNKKVFIFIFSILVVFLFLYPANISYADSTRADASSALRLSTDQGPLDQLGGLIDQLGNKIGDISLDIGAGALGIAIKFFAVIIALTAGMLQLLTTVLLHISVYFLNICIQLSTYGFSNLVRGDTGTAIKEGWTIFRDLSNIGLIFVLLYIAVSTIIQSTDFQTKKLLVRTIIVALLINFSYFFGGLVIDVSNNMAVSLVTSINEEIRRSDGSERGIAGFVFAKTEIGQMINTIKEETGLGGSSDLGGLSRSLENSEGGLLDNAVKWAAGLSLGVVMNILLIIVFSIASILLITRIIVLIFLLITSPIAFASSILPNTEKMSKDWWEGIVGNAFFLPLFLLFLLVAFKLMNSGVLNLGSIASQEELPSFSGTGDAFNIRSVIEEIIGPFVQYAIVLGLFLGALMASRKLSMSGGTMVSKVSGKITSSIGGAAFGAAGFAGRNTVGRAANFAANTNFLKDKAASSRIGSLVLKGTQGVAAGSFDARGSKSFQGVASNTGFGDKDLGDPKGVQKGGYRQQLKDQVEARTNFAAKSIGQRSDSHKDVDPEKKKLTQAEEALENAEYNVKGKKGVAKRAAELAVVAAKKDLKTKQKVYTAAKNKNLDTYASRLKKPALSVTVKGKAVPLSWVGKKNKDSSSKVLRELGKAQKDFKHDVIKSLEASAKKEEKK
ncbi:hypothetical protein N9L18_00145 [Candidatus Pacebacteria bacterium]|nr:hypothetical protein [Candidatus Paceibacterota bacterium]